MTADAHRYRPQLKFGTVSPPHEKALTEARLSNLPLSFFSFALGAWHTKPLALHDKTYTVLNGSTELENGDYLEAMEIVFDLITSNADVSFRTTTTDTTVTIEVV